MNGIFHTSAQKIYLYGNFKPQARLLRQTKKVLPNNYNQRKVFEDVCKTVEILLDFVEPKKRLIMCVDGPAPYAKQIQQKRRRFRSAMEREPESLEFDSNQITPGTLFMENLSKFIDWYIRKKISNDPRWKDIEVVFSNHRVPGEGEHKMLNYVRQYGQSNESCCIYGSDADLIMLSLGLNLDKVYILRDNVYDRDGLYLLINIQNTILQLSEFIQWESDKHQYSDKNSIDDFVFICFMVGNDFLPHIPSIEIIESGIDIIVRFYTQACQVHGHILQYDSGTYFFNKKALKLFFEMLASHEKEILEKKATNRLLYFPDPVLDACTTSDNKGITVDIDKYRKLYNDTYFSKKIINKTCHDYLNGMHWVIGYYKKGVPSWRWYYEHDYAPLASDLAKSLDTFSFKIFLNKNDALLPFQQLFAVLPPKSSKLLPEPLCHVICEDSLHDFKRHYPDKFEIDRAGKKNDWQGVVLIPIIEPDMVLKEYKRFENKIPERDLRRNTIGKSFVYSYNPDFSTTFKSYYGDIENCRVFLRSIRL